ncbi:hemolysin XhlA family protein [Clostridium culturomicium]|uniref:hemolysin XhlA family protein n=1 Tax=Clostridium culturomicium TaxID=1499683 RepID=UPI00058C2EC8|nr:hemolysin XhlA family protein [Clostridium culturomicium]
MSDSDAMQEVRETVIEIKGILKNMSDTTELKLKNFEEKIKVANNRIADLEDTNKWLWRAFAGTIVSSVMALLINIKF